MKKDQAGGTTYDRLYWTGGGSDPLAESDLAGTISEEYVFFGGKRIARRVVATGHVFYYFADHLGTSRAILQAGYTSPCFDADFYPFGAQHPPVTDTCPQNYKFTGKERDAESNLDYFGARYYASSSGRFLSADEFTGGPVDAFSASDPLPPGPLPYADITNPQSLNKYTYTYNNPLKYTDPNGHAVETPWDAANVVMGAVSFVKNVASGNVVGAAVDAVGILIDVAATAAPGIPGGAGAAIKAARAAGKADDVIDGAKALLKVGDKAGDGAKTGNAFEVTAENLGRMEKGKAPISTVDKKPIELHHPGQQPVKPVEMTRTEHRGAGNYKKNHPIGNKEPSKIDRRQAAQDRRAHWKQRAEEIRRQSSRE